MFILLLVLFDTVARRGKSRPVSSAGAERPRTRMATVLCAKILSKKFFRPYFTVKVPKAVVNVLVENASRHELSKLCCSEF